MVDFPPRDYPKAPRGQARRTATTVLSGESNQRPIRDVLTRHLSGVAAYTPFLEVEIDDAGNGQKGVNDTRKRQREDARPDLSPAKHRARTSAPQPSTASSSFWRARGRHSDRFEVRVPSTSVTSPPFTSTTTEPPVAIAVHPTSRTPDNSSRDPFQYPAPKARPKKPRATIRPGWKGWVEASPPPPDKLINLNDPPDLRTTRTRSGKTFVDTSGKFERL